MKSELILLASIASVNMLSASNSKYNPRPDISTFEGAAFIRTLDPAVSRLQQRAQRQKRTQKIQQEKARENATPQTPQQNRQYPQYKLPSIQVLIGPQSASFINLLNQKARRLDIVSKFCDSINPWCVKNVPAYQQTHLPISRPPVGADGFLIPTSTRRLSQRHNQNNDSLEKK